MLLETESKPLRKILNKIDPRIEPCGILDRIFSQELYDSFILAFCFLFDKQLLISLDESKLKPYVFNFAT